MSVAVNHTFPASHVLQLVTFLRRVGQTPEALLQGSGLSEATLTEPQLRVSAETLVTLTDRARTISGEPGLGFHLGLQRRITIYGLLGFALGTADTVHEALQLAVRYAGLVSSAVSLELRVQEPHAILEVHEHADMGSCRDVALFSLLVGLRNLGSTLTGRPENDSELVEVPIPRPAYYDRFAHLLPEVRFEQPLARLLFPVSALALPLAMADPAAKRLAVDMCERQLGALNYDLQFPARVRRLLVGEEGFRSLVEVAGMLHVSPRTLKRKLAAQGASFSDLLAHERYGQALHLLRHSALSMEEIADQLQYSSRANFARAFRRWAGESPGSYRRRNVPLELETQYVNAGAPPAYLDPAQSGPPAKNSSK